MRSLELHADGDHASAADDILNTQMSETPDSSVRRRFLQTAAAGSGLLLLKPETVFSYQANSSVELGLIGCGGRGNWIGPFFPEYAGARIVALADVIREHLDTTASKFKVEGSRAHYGPNAYQEVIASKVDGVIIETPPYFHPEQARAAVEAGKHVYLAKPVAVDVPGCKSILESGRKAQGKVTLPGGFPDACAARFSGGGVARAPRRHRETEPGPDVLLRRTPRCRQVAAGHGSRRRAAS